jgi:hypothetical protein
MHDGQLGNGRIVEYDDGFFSLVRGNLGIAIYEEFGERRGHAKLTYRQVLELLAWLKQEEGTLLRLAKDEEDEE